VFGDLQRKRTFKNIRESILICLASGQNTVNKISAHTSINWRSVEHHLAYLVGRGLVNNVLDSRFVRIFELSDLGRQYVRRLGINPVEQNNHNYYQRVIRL
jgi:DNA-binding transcriptional ArsR family regulator